MKDPLTVIGIIVAFKTPLSDIARVRRQLKERFNASSIVIDNTRKNVGFAAAANEGISRALVQGADVCIVCNPDINFTAGDTDALQQATAEFDIFSGSMKQNRVTYFGGTIDYWTMGGGLSTAAPKQRFSGCDFVSGSFMCITRKTIETIGMFSLHYFLYYEDTDFCFRAKQKGLRVGITKDIVFAHRENSKNFAEKNYYLSRNRLKFLFTHGSLMHKIREVIRLPLLVLRLYMNKSVANSLQLQGYIDFIYGKEISH